MAACPKTLQTVGFLMGTSELDETWNPASFHGLSLNIMTTTYMIQVFSVSDYHHHSSYFIIYLFIIIIIIIVIPIQDFIFLFSLSACTTTIYIKSLLFLFQNTFKCILLLLFSWFPERFVKSCSRYLSNNWQYATIHYNCITYDIAIWCSKYIIKIAFIWPVEGLQSFLFIFEIYITLCLLRSCITKILRVKFIYFL